MKAGRVVRIRDNVPQGEHDYVGAPSTYTAGYLAKITRAVGAGEEDRLENTNGPCDAFVVEMLEGPSKTETWWIPATWVVRHCMFGDGL